MPHFQILPIAGLLHLHILAAGPQALASSTQRRIAPLIAGRSPADRRVSGRGCAQAGPTAAAAAAAMKAVMAEASGDGAQPSAALSRSSRLALLRQPVAWAWNGGVGSACSVAHRNLVEGDRGHAL